MYPVIHVYKTASDVNYYTLQPQPKVFCNIFLSIFLVLTDEQMLQQYSDTGNNFIYSSRQMKSFHKIHLV